MIQTYYVLKCLDFANFVKYCQRPMIFCTYMRHSVLNECVKFFS